MDTEGRPCLYPIEFFTGVFRPEISDGGEAAQWAKDSGEEERPTVFLKIPPAAVINSMEQYFREVRGLLGDLFASGLYSVQEETMIRCRELGAEGEQMGLHQAGRDLMEVYGLLEGRRHQMDFSPEPVIEALGRAEIYGSTCRERILRDKALSGLRSGADEKMENQH